MKEEEAEEGEGLDLRLFLPAEHPYADTACLAPPHIQGARALAQSWQVLPCGRANQEHRMQDACRAM